MLVNCLGGRRVPLSGMRSGYNTKADVMGAPALAGLYIEVKADGRFQRLLEHIYTECDKGACVATWDTGFGDLVFFYIPSKLKAELVVCDSSYALGYEKQFPSTGALLTFFSQELYKAQAESKEVVIVFKVRNYNGRNMRGFLCLTQWSSYKKAVDLINEAYRHGSQVV